MVTNKPIYADYNSTTPVDAAVFEEMLPYFSDYFGNASSKHWYGYKSREAIELARHRVSECIGCRPHEVIFTSGATESNNFALKGIAYANQHHGKHIITTSVEHQSVLQPCRYLESQGFSLTILPVDDYGMVSVDDLKDAIREDTILISVMHANNEVGTIEPIPEIGNIAKEFGIYFHSDAAQTIGKIPVNVDDLGVDLLSISGHKFYGPKGVGAIYIREGTEIDPLIGGNSQEFRLRSGSENVPGIVGLGKACQIVAESLNQSSSHMLKMRERLFELFITSVPQVLLIGHPTARVPNTVNLAFPGVVARDLLLATPEVSALAEAECDVERYQISHVLKAMHIPETYALGSIRFSFGKWTTEYEIDDIVDFISARYEQLLEGHHHAA
ncbi:MAG: cysteine desulfurase [Firmicutes bacterium]|nr:cysteine desulfurase [Bacillota bacterium]